MYITTEDLKNGVWLWGCRGKDFQVQDFAYVTHHQIPVFVII